MTQREGWQEGRVLAWKQQMYPLRITRLLFRFFFFQAEDGIRDYKVTGVQTCALPIYVPAQQVRKLAVGGVFSLTLLAVLLWGARALAAAPVMVTVLNPTGDTFVQIGRASCRERV